MGMAAVTTGASAEQAAEAHLRRQGLRTLARNYRSRFGELDLIMQDGDELVFVEVRRRSSRAYGDGLDSVDRHKQRRLALAAQRYMSRHRPRCLQSRFDVVAVSDQGIKWVKNAFTLDDL